MGAHQRRARDPPATPLAHAVEAAEAEVEEGRRDEREGSEEEEQTKEAAGRKEAAEAE